MKLLIRADASPSMGTGHVMRCMALAEAASLAGIEATLLCRSSVDWLNARLARSGINFKLLRGEVPFEEDPEQCIEEINAFSDGQNDTWIVLDGYHFCLDCQREVRKAGHSLLLIDDFQHLPEYSCDILLNQNIGSHTLAYKGQIGKKLLGAHYTLLRQEFLKARSKVRSKRDLPRNILISLGGGNFHKALEELANNLDLLERRNLRFRIVKGAMPEAEVRRIFSRANSEVEILGTIDNMSRLLLETDLCISAGGSTCWELCCLGVPFMTVEIAENQSAIIQYLGDKCGIRRATREIFDEMLVNTKLLESQRKTEMEIVDGNGCRRVIYEMRMR